MKGLTLVTPRCVWYFMDTRYQKMSISLCVVLQVNVTLSIFKFQRQWFVVSQKSFLGISLITLLLAALEQFNSWRYIDIVKSRYCETSSFFLMNSLRCFVIMDQSQTVALRIGDFTPILAKFSSLSGNFEICDLDSTIKLSRTFRTYNPSVILRLQGPITDHKNVCLLSSPNKRMIPQFVGTVRRWFVIPLDMTMKRYNTINGRVDEQIGLKNLIARFPFCCQFTEFCWRLKHFSGFFLKCSLFKFNNFRILFTPACGESNCLCQQQGGRAKQPKRRRENTLQRRTWSWIMRNPKFFMKATVELISD